MNGNSELPEPGPFITVVSVDGGLQKGNKLTVITPTSNDASNWRGSSRVSGIPISRSKSDLNSSAAAAAVLRSQSREVSPSSPKGKISAIPTLVGVDRKPVNSHGPRLPEASCKFEENSAAAAYITVVSLSEQQKEARGGNTTTTTTAASSSKSTTKSGIPVKSCSNKNLINTKSIVKLTGGNERSPGAHASEPLDQNQIITISNKVKGDHARNSSIVEISSQEAFEDQGAGWQLSEEIGIPSEITEPVTVYRLPGEKLGFGLRFDGGLTNSADKVRHLYIQSCAVDSPSIKAKTSWGHLQEGDEIVEIESTPVGTMTRMECIQRLKDASVAVTLLIRHNYNAEETSLLRAQREIALKKQKFTACKKEGSVQNKTEGASETESKIDHKEEAINNTNSHHDDFYHHVRSNSLNQNITTAETTIVCSRIPMAKSKEACALGSCNSINYDHNGNININEMISHEDQSSLCNTAQEGTSDAHHQLVKLKPPTGFSDELFTSQPSSDRCRGTSGKKPSSAGASKLVATNSLPPSEAQFYLNAISPTHSQRIASAMSLECPMDSDETGSSRSTVVSRLSMASSVTSMSATVDNSISYATANAHNATNGSTCNNGMKRKSSLSSISSWPEAVAGDGQNDREYEKRSDNNNVSTIACNFGGEVGIVSDTPSSQSEVPLPPPLFFQDIQAEPSVMRLIENNLVSAPTATNSAEQPQQQPVESVSAGTKLHVRSAESTVALVVQEHLRGEANNVVDVGQAENANVAEVRSAETNWEQKGILDYDDDDELALLAEELGLDQEDEDLFNSVAAEMDGANGGSLYENTLGDDSGADCGKRIHEPVMHPQRDQPCATLICPSDHYIGDGKSSTGARQKSAFGEPEHTVLSWDDEAASSVAAAPKSISGRLKPHLDEEGASANGSPVNGNMANNDRLFPSFSKVVEPISSEIIMTSKTHGKLSTLAGVDEEQPMHRASTPEWKHENGSKSGLSKIGSQMMTEEVVDSLSRTIQAPAPPPRSRVGDKKYRKESCEKNLDIEDSAKTTGRGIEVPRHDQERPSSAATIVKIETWTDSRGGESTNGDLNGEGRIKSEVRRYNSLTLSCSETSRISSEEAAVVSRKRRDDDNLGDHENAESKHSSGGIDDSSHKDGNLATYTTKQGSQSGDRANVASSADAMESSTELLQHHLPHQFSPPTFSRLPPDGDEFPNSCWSDEKLHQHSQQQQIPLRRKISREDDSSSSEQIDLPPPLPTSEPPKDDLVVATTELPPLPKTIPPGKTPAGGGVQGKMPATRACSFDERKRMFESGPGSHGNMVKTSDGGLSNGFSSATTKAADEPSKKSVKDKIAMFSSRSSSSEEGSDSFVPKPFTNHVSSSLSKSTMNISNASALNGFSKSSENLLGSSSVTPTPRQSSLVESGSGSKFNQQPTPFYGSLRKELSSNISYSRQISSNDRSQSMVDVAVPATNGSSYQKINGAESGSFYNNATNKTCSFNSHAGMPTSSMMEQRRKCISKLRGLVIPDVNDGTNGHPTTTSSSVADLPTIISKDAAILSPQPYMASKPPVHSNPLSQNKKPVSRTESLDRFSSTNGDNNMYNNINNNNNNNNNRNKSAKSNDIAEQTAPNATLNGDWKSNNSLSKYSPAFKRRGFSAYSSSSLPCSNSYSTKLSNNTNATSKLKSGTNNNITPEPKSLESLTSPRSDSSFEFSSPSPDKSSGVVPTKVAAQLEPVDSKKAADVVSKPAPKATKFPTKGSGKLEDSDNDSAVSSSRSSISHGLSPPNSPTPGESTANTPDPDSRDDTDGKQDSSEESQRNLEESWRVLKPSSIEAINRKNVLKSAKFSSGGGNNSPADPNEPTTDDSSLSSTGKNRRSDDEEASYADAETEDTESSCSELEVGGRRRSSAGRVCLKHGPSEQKVDTDDDELEDSSQQSAVNMEFTELTESPLQAIYDMEAKMAYINEVCDALNDRGRSELSSRYFSRRDSEATVIERPIQPVRKSSAEKSEATAAERRSRNRSSSGNESDFSSNMSVGSHPTNHKTLSREGSNSTVDADKWSMLEKKYSRSVSSLNAVGRQDQNSPVVNTTTTSTTATAPKVLGNAGEVVEKKIEKIIEKKHVDVGGPKRSTANIPRGRNDFKSIAEKWQTIEKSSERQVKAVISGEKVYHSTAETSTLSTPTAVDSNKCAKTAERKSDFLQQKEEPEVSTPNRSQSSVAERSWTDKLPTERTSATRKSEPLVALPMNTTKRSVSVNDIRKAFEKTEQVSSGGSYNREESSPIGTKKESTGTLTLPSASAHFRVSSFDSTTSEESSAATPAGLYGSSNSLISSAPRDPYGSITSLASSTSLISPQELQQLIDEANQSLEEAGTPSHEVSVVILHREFASGSLGITLAGGADYETKEITVHKVLTASIADRDGRIFRGDRILSINGKSTKGLTHREALNLLKSPRTEVVLVISRGRTTSSNGFQTIEETSALDRAVQPLINGNLVIENDDDTCYKWGPLRTVTLIKDGAGLGFSLEGGKGSIHGDKPLTVKKIFIGGPAEKGGELKVGDLIVSINAVNMSSKSRTEAWNFMKKLSDGDVKIAIRSPLT